MEQKVVFSFGIKSQRSPDASLFCTRTNRVTFQVEVRRARASEKLVIGGAMSKTVKSGSDFKR
jgi:hypothetical protein